MIEALTGDGALVLFSTLGLVVTAVSMVRDARAQKQRLATQDFSLDLPFDRAA